MESNLISEAVKRRIKNHRRNQTFYLFTGTIVAICGIAILFALWIWLEDESSEVVKTIASLSAAMISTGTGGFLFKEAISCRQNIIYGSEWMLLYDQARRPPPHERLAAIEERIFEWLTK